MYICILDAAGEVVVHRNGSCSPKHFLHVIAPYRDADAFRRLRSVPGIGKILALVILYEIHDISRFPHVQEFASYSRLVKCQKSSAGKLSGYSGTKIGNAHLKWAFPEAAVLFLRNNPLGRPCTPVWPTSLDRCLVQTACLTPSSEIKSAYAPPGSTAAPLIYDGIPRPRRADRCVS